jgi:hypothetical protein
MIERRTASLAALAAMSSLLAGCLTMPSSGSSSSSSPAPAPAPAAAAAPAAPKGPGPGMSASGEVMDPKKVEAGHGTKVKGINDWEGEITGRPVAGSKFDQLKIGMGMKQVTDIVGQPTDQGAYITGKAFIPFFFGSDRHRFEMTFKGKGRLIFAGGNLGDYSGGNLIWIIHSAHEQGYR